jgi:FlaA1/EpsC-like NDP-sugar epimerase
MLNFYDGKTVAIFGGGSYVAKFVINLLLTSNVKKIICLDVSEDKVFWLKHEYRHDERLCAFVSDVTNRESLLLNLEEFDVAFYMAACKHVGLAEESPLSAMAVNSNALADVMHLSESLGCKQFVYASSDKSVSPTNVMGATKLLGERVVACWRGAMKTASVRFGNVLGSPGSILPILMASRASGSFTLRGESATRFLMNANESARLILSCAKLLLGGEIFVMRMTSVRIAHLVDAFCEQVQENISIKSCNLLPGEKLYEDLIYDSEIEVAKVMHDFLVVDPRNLHRLPLADKSVLENSHKSFTTDPELIKSLIVTGLRDMAR